MAHLPPPAWLVLAFALVAALLQPATPAAAQSPTCADANAGMVACIAGRLCACGLVRGSVATGLPDGFRWDCGILRPRCGEPVPATLDPYLGPLPEALSIERETNNTTIINRNRAQTGGDRYDRHRR